MHPSALAVFLTAILLCGARPAGAQSAHERSGSVPEKTVYVGAGGQFLISQSPGLAVTVLLSVQWRQLVISGEAGFADIFSGWEGFHAAAQAGAVLLPSPWTPYLLAGIEDRIFLDIAHDGRRGSDEVALTAEAGYAFRHLGGGRQIWLGARGIFAITSHVYHDVATGPQLPVAALVAKFFL
jgi:hypothetical protein